MVNEAHMSSWNDLLHSSTKILEQSTSSAQFPSLQRNLDQLESLSKKLKAKTRRTEAPSQSIAATRLLAREGINAEQLARGLKAFEIKTTTFEDVFPAEATSVNDYLQQVHEMAMVSAVQQAQKDNLRSFNDYTMKVLEEDWQNEKRDFLQSLNRISTLPKTNFGNSNIQGGISGQLVPTSYSPHVSSRLSLEAAALANKSIIEKKGTVYSEAVKSLNNARESGLLFKPAAAFRTAYEHLDLESSGGKSISMQKIWHLVQALIGEDIVVQKNISKKMSLVIGARRHLEWGHQKYIMDTIQSHPAQAALGGAVGNLQRVRAFLRIGLRDYGILDFDAGDAHRQPPIDTTWQQIYFCLRTGYYEEAKEVALSSRASRQFAPQLTEWIITGGMVSAETAASASEECEKLIRMGDRGGRAAYDQKKLLLYAIISGLRKQIDCLLREHPTLFNTIEDFLWFKLAAVRDCPSGSSSIVLSESLVPYTLNDLQTYLNKFQPSFYTKKGKDPLVYPYVLLLSIQFLPAILYLSKENGDEGYNIDAIHISIALADHGVVSECSGEGKKLGTMDSLAEASSLIRQYGSQYLRVGNLSMALEYYAQAAASVGGGQLSWMGRSDVDQQRQRVHLLNQLLTELLLRDGGIYLLLGSKGSGEEGELIRFLTDVQTRHRFLLDVVQRCMEAGLYDKAIEIQKRVGAFSMALNTINQCLSEAICALSRGRLDGESRISGLIHSGNEILETFKYYHDHSYQERELVHGQQITLRHLEAILSIHKMAKVGQYGDALRILPFLSLDNQAQDLTEVFKNLSPHVQSCFPDLLRLALSCLDNVTNTDGSFRALRTRIANFLANNLNQNWPRDLYEKVARNL